MTPTALARVVAMLYTAAGRHYGEVELEVFSLALEDVTDERGLQAAKNIIRNLDLGQRAPSPYIVIEEARSIARRELENQLALPSHTGPFLSREENARRMGEAARALKRMSDVK